MQKNQLTYFSKNQKLLKSTYGARRTVMLKYLDVLGGVPTNTGISLNLNFVRRLMYNRHVCPLKIPENRHVPYGDIGMAPFPCSNCTLAAFWEIAFKQ